jgi:hypothetical protein
MVGELKVHYDEKDVRWAKARSAIRTMERDGWIVTKCYPDGLFTDEWVFQLYHKSQSAGARFWVKWMKAWGHHSRVGWLSFFFKDEIAIWEKDRTFRKQIKELAQTLKDETDYQIRLFLLGDESEEETLLTEQPPDDQLDKWR